MIYKLYSTLLCFVIYYLLFMNRIVSYLLSSIKNVHTMTHVGDELKLRSVGRSGRLHAQETGWHPGVHNAQAAHAFSAGIKYRNCMSSGYCLRGRKSVLLVRRVAIACTMAVVRYSHHWSHVLTSSS